MARALLLLGLLLLTGLALAQLPAAAQPPARPAANAWTTVAPLPFPRKRAAAAAYPPNGKLYLFGGRWGVDGADLVLPFIFEYTPGDPGTWVQKNAHLPYPPGDIGRIYTANPVAATLTGTLGAAIYIVGGNDRESVPTDTVRIYWPWSDTVSVLDSDPWPANPPRVPGGWAVLGNKLFLFGGFNAYTGQAYADTWVFDPLAAPGRRWTQMLSANLAVPRAFIAGAALDGYVYAIGGDTYSNPNPTPNPNPTVIPVTTVERLLPTDPHPQWQLMAALPGPRGDAGAWAFASDSPTVLAGSIVVAGGTWFVPDAQGYQYLAAQNTWVAFANLIQGTRNYGVAQLDTQLYAIGGYDFSGGLPDSMPGVQRYDAALVATTTPGAGTLTPTNTAPPAPSNTTTRVPPSATIVRPTNTPTSAATLPPPAATSTAVPPTPPVGPSPTPCLLSFSDVHILDYFYTPVLYLYCHGVISGYNDGTFRPANNTTRAQMVKIVVLSYQKPLTIPAGSTYTFEDVPRAQPFFAVIETAAALNIVAGYTCGQAPAGPCVPPLNRPYFLPTNNVTRGQLSKIDVAAAGWATINPASRTFEDVLPNTAFYTFVATAANRNVISGYTCGAAPAGPCLPPSNRPYFLPGHDAIRGQIAKIVYNSIRSGPAISTPGASDR